MNKISLCKKGFVTVSATLALFLSLPFASTVYIQQSTLDRIYETVESAPEKNVALVLGAAAYPTSLSDILADRMETAIELYETEKVQKLILSGAPNEVEGMKKYALERGVEENDLIEDPKGLNTLASIRNASDISELIIVTQAFHLPRALFIAKHLGISAVGIASDRRTYAKIFDFKKREVLATSKAMMDLFILK
ncbi:YdcF family protein [Candidatus Peregrinibacteria bacterium]|nr:YdcF family protein [Candidatus Peregrinibacteria bacterium]